MYASKEERAFAAKQKAAKEWVRSMHANEGAAAEKSPSKKNLNKAWKLMLRWTNTIRSKMKDAAEKKKLCAKILPGSLWKLKGASPLLLDTDMLCALADAKLQQTMECCETQRIVSLRSRRMRSHPERTCQPRNTIILTTQCSIQLCAEYGLSFRFRKITRPSPTERVRKVSIHRRRWPPCQISKRMRTEFESERTARKGMVTAASITRKCL